MVRILLRFSEELVPQPITSQIILEYKVPIAILTANVNSKGGEILAEIPDEAQEKIIQAFRKRGVSVTVPKLIDVDADKCFSCGSCVALCPVEAIILASDCSVKFDKEKCVGSTCSVCVDACPARAIKSIKNSNSNSKGNNQEK
jgi:Na+-translocating ferredoxin:NAD+ oxidoreductase RNF subunit RnfB